MRYKTKRALIVSTLSVAGFMAMTSVGLAKSYHGNTLLDKTITAADTLVWSMKSTFQKNVKMLRNLVVKGSVTLGDASTDTVELNGTLQSGVGDVIVQDDVQVNGSVDITGQLALDNVVTVNDTARTMEKILQVGQTNTITSLDGDTTIVGLYTSATVGKDGLALISYYDDTNDDLKVAHCEDEACTTATVSTLDSTGSVGQYTSIIMAADGYGMISYYDETNGDLKVAHCTNTACTSANVASIDGSGNVGKYTSIATGSDGMGVISYYDVTNGDLKVAKCSTTECYNTATANRTVDSTGDVGLYTAVAMAPDGYPLMSYYDSTNTNLKTLKCSTASCSSGIVTTIDSDGTVGTDTSIVVGNDGFGLISYYDGTTQDLKVAHCENSNCSTATVTTIASATSTLGSGTAITLGTDGLGLIAYNDVTNASHFLKVAHCANSACSTATTTILNETDGIGSGLTMMPDGFGLISNYDATNGNLQVVKAGSPYFTEYWTRR